MSLTDIRVGHLEHIESPFANAGGVVKSVEDVERMAQTGVGWIEAGSYTLEPRKGNKWDELTETYCFVKDYDYDPKTKAMHNSLGMPNPGMDLVETQIPEMARIAKAAGKPLVVNVAPVTHNPAEESLELINRAYAAGADGVILNAGCPNVVNTDGTSHSVLSRSHREFGKVLNYLSEHDPDMRIWVRTSPQGEDYTEMRSMAAVLIGSKIVTAVLHTNTWAVPMPKDKVTGEPLLDVPVKQVGKSGPDMAHEAAKEVKNAVKAFKSSKVDVIQSSGIFEARHIRTAQKTGADAAAGTTFFYVSEDWKNDTNRLLSDLAA